MESTTSSPKNTSKIYPTAAAQTAIVTVIFLSLAILIFASILNQSPPPAPHPPLTPSSSSSLMHPSPLINTACAKTLYPSLCFATFSSLSESNNPTNLHQILEFSITRTMEEVSNTLADSLGHFVEQDMNAQEKTALNDCREMLDQTLYELRQAIDELHDSRDTIAFLRRSYGDIKTLLSAAMTNENTCIGGFSELAESDSNCTKDAKEHVRNVITPISRMISNCLAIIKQIETIRSELEALKNHPRAMIEKDGFLSWMGIGDRKLMEKERRSVRWNAVVAKNGRGDYRTIGEAIKMAPNKSLSRYVIRVRAGIYEENVVVPRKKSNIMLVGDGMNSTVISGSRNFVDGFSTFTSATLTVVGDKFLARDLKIINTAGPAKHQAVALRTTSNAAFYRCHIVSYQDTLYAHSLRQLYRDCTVEGTVDFIFGNAAAIFQNCQILVRKPNPGQQNMITAQGREDPNQNTGISLQNCTVTGASDFPATERENYRTFLGRPWRNYSRTIVMNSYLGEIIHPEGWCKWDEYSSLDKVQYIEYMNRGPGSDTRGRVSWPGYRNNCTEDMAKQFAVGAFLRGADDWLESTVFPLFNRPKARRGPKPRQIVNNSSSSNTMVETFPDF